MYLAACSPIADVRVGYQWFITHMQSNSKVFHKYLQTEQSGLLNGFGTDQKSSISSSFRDETFPGVEVSIHDYNMYLVVISMQRGSSCVRHFHHTNLSQALNIIQGHLLGRSFDMLISWCQSFQFNWRRLWMGEFYCVRDGFKYQGSLYQ